MSTGTTFQELDQELAALLEVERFDPCGRVP